MRLNLALRNIFRHRGRTLVSLLMVAGAVTGLVLFSGFSDYILTNMQRIAIDNQVGHMQVAQRAFWDLAPGERKSQLILDTDKLTRALASDPEVETVSGRFNFFGLLSTGDITVSAKGMGYDPVKEIQFEKNLRILEGEGLGPKAKLDVILGVGLQKKVGAKVGGSVTVLGYTLDGVVNAMDLNVKGIFTTTNAEIDNNLFMLPLATAQTLLDTERVELLTIRIRETSRTDAVRARLQMVAQKIEPTYQVKTWFELSTFFRQVDSFFKSQNLIIKIILLSLVFLGILNTIGMSVYERTGEIGTVRALGETTQSVIFQFTLEGMILGILGALIGAIGGLLTGSLISSLHIMMELPGMSIAVPLRIYHVPSAYFEAMFIVIVASTIATWIPSIRASKISIVEALKKNI